MNINEMYGAKCSSLYGNTLHPDLLKTISASKFRKIIIKRKVGKRTMRSQVVVRSNLKNQFTKIYDEIYNSRKMSSDEFKKQYMCTWNGES